jgi:hypothetical protein
VVDTLNNGTTLVVQQSEPAKAAKETTTIDSRIPDLFASSVKADGAVVEALIGGKT